MPPRGLRNLVIVLGDQLDAKSSAFDGFKAPRDAVWMAEVAEESTHVKSHKVRIALFLSAMRHFRDELRARDIPVHYTELGDRGSRGALGGALVRVVRKLRPEKLVMTEAGEHRVGLAIERAARDCGVELEVREDRHFLCSKREFAEHAEGRKQLRMEYFYREMRRKTGVLMDGGKPIGGAWNFDAENRGSFGKSGPGDIREPKRFKPDRTTKEVIALVGRRFANHPGSLDRFDWPVTRRQALAALRDFVKNRLPRFGEFQDAMWTGDGGKSARRDAYLHHSRVSAALNLKLLNPREVLEAAEESLREKAATIASVEGFVRQILGWREFVRGVYWLHMPGYAKRNALGASAKLPGFYWTADTPMNCLRQAIGQTMEFGYAHHIQRLMVTGLYALLLGVEPRRVHEWYLAVYVDAVEWVEMPNTIGMSQYADGGVMASKPYVATGKYIQRMSNYCEGCRFDPAEATGDNACPFTTLYWNFLLRHEKVLARNPRMTMQLRNLRRLAPAKRRAIRARAERLGA